MTFASLRRYRTAVFLAGDDIAMPIPVRVMRTVVVVAFAWLLTVVAYTLFNRLVGGRPDAEASRLAAFSVAADALREELVPGEAARLPSLILEVEPTVEAPDRYIRSGRIEHRGALLQKHTLLAVRGAQPGWLFPTVREIRTPVSIHPLLDAVGRAATAEVEPSDDAAAPPPARVDDAIALKYVQGLQALFTEHLGGDLGWQPVSMRRLNGRIQFATAWLFFAALLIISARFVCNILPDRRVRLIGDFGPESEVETPWRTDGGDSRALLDQYGEAIAAFDANTSILGVRIQSPFLELRRYAFAAFAVAENISQIPSFLEAKASSLGDRLYASLAMTRYLIWAIPTVGFVGTVVGIGASLERTAELQSPEPLTVAIAKGAVSTSIGVAFDTTFVALVLSLLAMLLYHLIQGLEEMNVVSRKDEVLDDLTHLENARPFRCQAAEVAGNLERLGLTAETLSAQLDRLPAAQEAVRVESPGTQRQPGPRRGLLAFLVLVVLGLVLVVLLHSLVPGLG